MDPRIKRISDHGYEVTEPTPIEIGKPASRPTAQAIGAIRAVLAGTGTTTVYWFWVSIGGDKPHLGLAVAPNDDGVVGRIGRAVEPVWRVHSPQNPLLDILRLGDPNIDPAVAQFGELLHGVAQARHLTRRCSRRAAGRPVSRARYTSARRSRLRRQRSPTTTRRDTHMDQNPYQAPSAAPSAALPPTKVRVEDKYLVVTSGTALPSFCVKTNRAVQPQDIQQRRLSWCPPIVGLLILLSGLLLILIYFIVRKHCTISFGLSPDIRKKYRNRRVFKVIAVILLFFALPFTAAIDNIAVVITVFILFLVAVVSLFIGNSPLAITKHRKGEFWISGCSKEFLARIQTVA